MTTLPEKISDLFWDIDPTSLRPEEHRDFIVQRVLTEGRWQQIQWLRRRLGDHIIRDVIERTEGRRLSPRDLRLWEVLLELSSDDVDKWVRRSRQSRWHRRKQ